MLSIAPISRLFLSNGLWKLKEAKIIQNVLEYHTSCWLLQLINSTTNFCRFSPCPAWGLHGLCHRQNGLINLSFDLNCNLNKYLCLFSLMAEWSPLSIAPRASPLDFCYLFIQKTFIKLFCLHCLSLAALGLAQRHIHSGFSRFILYSFGFCSDNNFCLWVYYFNFRM